MFFKVKRELNKDKKKGFKNKENEKI